jgi:SPP1 family predicted phage head-tail adaptor
MSGGLRVQAGRLRHRVEVQTREQTFDGAGQPVDSWTTVGTAHASVEPLRGRELFRAREAGQEATHRVRMRWSPTLRVNGKWQVGRIVHAGRVMTPEGPPMDLDERGKVVEVLVTERTDG